MCWYYDWLLLTDVQAIKKNTTLDMYVYRLHVSLALHVWTRKLSCASSTLHFWLWLVNFLRLKVYYIYYRSGLSKSTFFATVYLIVLHSMVIDQFIYCLSFTIYVFLCVFFYVMVFSKPMDSNSLHYRHTFTTTRTYTHKYTFLIRIFTI